jgi:hypothetical protein
VSPNLSDFAVASSPLLLRMTPAVRTLDARERLAAGESADRRKVAVNHGAPPFAAGAR